VHAITARGQLHQRFNLLPVELSRRDQLFKLFFHKSILFLATSHHNVIISASFKRLNNEKPRQIAVRVLRDRMAGGTYTEDLLERELGTVRLSPADRALCQELVYGIVRWQTPLDWLVTRKTEGRTQKDLLRILLQLGLYQMFWLDRIPNHAAVHETVEMAREFGFGPQTGFINAVLRGYARERVETQKLLADLKISQPPIGWSHPEWLYQRWLSRWGAEKTAQLLAWNNTPPPTFARVNGLKTDAAKLTAQWETRTVKFTPRQFDWVEDGLVFQLDSHPPLAGLRSFQEGLFYIQDPSTLLAVMELNPRPGESVLDLCAAPGGKTTFIAQRMQNRGHITAQDAQPDRLELIRENCARLGVTCVETSIAPAGVLTNPAKKFDRILVDAPCSNTGVMRRRIDLRWRIRPEEIPRLHAEQLSLLTRAAPRLKPGGTLVYSTCSLEPEENAEVVKEFLAAHPQLRLERERELLPFADAADGAYIAKITSVREK
jgi:16S rRNA (cytosine967-C5)-methyltransferase